MDAGLGLGNVRYRGLDGLQGATSEHGIRERRARGSKGGAPSGFGRARGNGGGRIDGPQASPKWLRRGSGVMWPPAPPASPLNPVQNGPATARSPRLPIYTDAPPPGNGYRQEVVGMRIKLNRAPCVIPPYALY